MIYPWSMAITGRPKRVSLETGDLVEIAVTTAAGDAIGFGIGYWLELERQANLALVEVGGLGMTGLALWLAESTVYERSDRLLLAARVRCVVSASLPGAHGGGGDRSRPVRPST